MLFSLPLMRREGRDYPSKTPHSVAGSRRAPDSRNMPPPFIAADVTRPTSVSEPQRGSALRLQGPRLDYFTRRSHPHQRRLFLCARRQERELELAAKPASLWPQLLLERFDTWGSVPT